MKIGDVVTDKLTGDPLKILDFLNESKSLMLVNIAGRGEITVSIEEVE